MISEPETEGEVKGFASHQVVGGFGREATERSRSRRPWLWAIGGAAATSVFWSMAVFRFELGIPEPDTRGYQLTEGACRSLQLSSLAADISSGTRTDVLTAKISKHPDLDHVQCFIFLRPESQIKAAGEGWSIDYSVGVNVALHKKVDPSAEFEAGRRVTGLGIVADEEVETVRDLGDKAYLITSDINNTELRVLDGGAVLSLSLSAMVSYHGEDATDTSADAPDTPDVSEHRTAMINDMRALMSALKQ
ncbi:hypothetical protein AB0O67_12750 [Streptomyces sp. NPDC086077]|uniref:hypothetical protein n=1 Tax=Streptomyces sp. NPDC086077 TaxID=3154862 RepID=UPI00343ABDD8